MIKVPYNANGKILGYYPDNISYTVIPEPYIEIDEAVHQECIDNPGLRKVDTVNKVIVVYTPPAPTEDEIKQQQLDALDAEYQPQFAVLSQALGMATLAENTDLIASIKEDYTALKAEYDTKRGEIIGS